MPSVSLNKPLNEPRNKLSATAKLSEIASFLDATLACSTYQDVAVNGLQVGWKGELVVTTVVGAVDSSLGVINDAIAIGADLLLAHHGVLWGIKEPRLSLAAASCALLAGHNIALYAAHLPLDGHIDLGNAAVLGRTLGLADLQPWYRLAPDSPPIGVRGTFKAPPLVPDLVNLISRLTGTINPLVLPFGVVAKNLPVRSVGIVTGSGSSALESAKDDSIDLLLSGEPKHEAFQRARDLDQCAVFAGHYATETWGVRALGELLRREFGLRVVFVDRPTGI